METAAFRIRGPGANQRVGTHVIVSELPPADVHVDVILQTLPVCDAEKVR